MMTKPKIIAGLSTVDPERELLVSIIKTIGARRNTQVEAVRLSRSLDASAARGSSPPFQRNLK